MTKIRYDDIESHKRKKGRKLPRVHVPVNFAVGGAILTRRLVRTENGGLIEEGLLPAAQTEPRTSANHVKEGRTGFSHQPAGDENSLNIMYEHKRNRKSRESNITNSNNAGRSEPLEQTTRDDCTYDRKQIKKRIYNDIQLLSRSEKDRLIAQLASDERRRIFGCALARTVPGLINSFQGKNKIGPISPMKSSRNKKLHPSAPSDVDGSKPKKHPIGPNAASASRPVKRSNATTKTLKRDNKTNTIDRHNNEKPDPKLHESNEGAIPETIQENEEHQARDMFNSSAGIKRRPQVVSCGTSMTPLPIRVEPITNANLSNATAHPLNNMPIVKVALNISGGQLLHEKTSGVGMKEIIFQCLDKEEPHETELVKPASGSHLHDERYNSKMGDANDLEKVGSRPEKKTKADSPAPSTDPHLVSCTNDAETKITSSGHNRPIVSNIDNVRYSIDDFRPSTNRPERKSAMLAKESENIGVNNTAADRHRNSHHFQRPFNEHHLSRPPKRSKLCNKVHEFENVIEKHDASLSRGLEDTSELNLYSESNVRTKTMLELEDEMFEDVILVPSPPEGPSRRPHELTNWLVQDGSPDNESRPYNRRKASNSLQTILTESFLRDCVESLAQISMDAQTGGNPSPKQKLDALSVHSSLKITTPSRASVPLDQCSEKPPISPHQQTSAGSWNCLNEKAFHTDLEEVQGPSPPARITQPGQGGPVPSSSSRYSGDRSLHIPLIGTRGRNPTRLQYVEIQVKSRNPDSPRKAHATAADTGPILRSPIPLVIDNGTANSPPKVNRLTRLTRDDIRDSRLVGQFDRSFIVLHRQLTDGQLNQQTGVCEANRNSLILIDQHALHERILLERLEDGCCCLRYDKWANVAEKVTSADSRMISAPSRELIPSVTIRIPRFELVARIRSERGEMQRHGFSVKLMGTDPGSGGPSNDRTKYVAIVHTAPRCLDTGVMTVLRQLTKDLFEEYLTGSSERGQAGQAQIRPRGKDYESFGLVLHRLLRMKACRTAIKCPTLLDRPTLEQLVKEMVKCRLPFQCCHGRPTAFPITLRWPNCPGTNEDSNSAEVIPTRAQRLQIAVIRERLAPAASSGSHVSTSFTQYDAKQ